METTREEREREYAEAEKVLARDDPAFPPAVRARQNAHADYLMRLCRDVDTLVGALREMLTGLEALIEAAGPPRNNATAIRGYEDALRRAAKARAVLGSDVSEN